MSDASLQSLELVVVSHLSVRQTITRTEIAATVGLFRCVPIYDSVTDDQAAGLVRELESRYNVTMTIGGVLKNKAHEPWLDAAQLRISPYFWQRYRTHLIRDKGFPHPVVTRIGEVTDRILGLMQDPLSVGPWDRRGLVVGHVQSGKTANYTGLACKAADAGYKLVVIIAGIHNNLRNQTQERIDEGFVGRDSAKLLSRQGDYHVGVGLIDSTRRPATFTNSHSDFRKSIADSVGISLGNLSEPAVLVIKKNHSTLKNLIDWLATHNADKAGQMVDLPMLLIDDEADNASINVKYGRGEASRINGLIRELLKLFGRSCYVGYTATPFANIFIDPDTNDEMLGEDLFPRDFVVSLDAPNNYYGAGKVFSGDDAGPVRPVRDSEAVLPLRHKIDHELESLPESMMAAVRTFIVARAIRLCRGQVGKHNSMLINASRFTRVQGKLALLIVDYLDAIKAALRVHGSLGPTAASRDPEIGDLERTWRSEYPDAGAEWPLVLGLLNDAAAPIRVVEINSRSGSALDYRKNEKHGLNVIAVGGLSLSRGLTLEGLTISYFLRNSLMYDTLMQMARWFGYRPGYEDLCRIWMPEEAAGWYEHIAESIELLRRDLKSMEAAGATPMDFGLKVRSHPDSLIVTARNKMGSGKNFAVRIGLANRFVETIALKDDRVARARNLSAATALSQRAQREGRRAGDEFHRGKMSHLFAGVPAAAVLEFLRAYDNHHASLLSDPGPVATYVQERAGDELAEWNIAFVSRDKPVANGFQVELAGLQIDCQQRTCGANSQAGVTVVVGSRNRVASRGVESYGLTQEEKARAQGLYVLHAKEQGGEPGKNTPDWAYRQVRKGRPLLIVHVLHMLPNNDVASGSRRPAESSGAPLVAWSMSLPETDKPDDTVEYVVSTVWMRENFGDDLFDEDDYEDDPE